jgi:glycosyltransferase involved in cell wall biosynthesis
MVLNTGPAQSKENTHTRILHIITRMIKGGAQRSTLLLADGLQMPPYNYEVLLCSGEELGSEGELISEVHKRSLPFFVIGDLVRLPNLVKDIKALFRLYQLIKKRQFEIVHTHTSKAGVLGRIAAKLAGTPIIVHTPHGHIFHSYFSPAVTFVYTLLEKFCSAFTDKIIMLTETERQEHIGPKIASPEKFVVIHSGVELEKFSGINIDIQNKKEELKIGQNLDIVATVGRLVPEKGHCYLIESAKGVIRKNPNTIFLIIGSGPLKDELEAMAQRLGISGQFRFLGLRDDVPEILHTIDLFVFPSLNEGMGRVLVEAMACSKAVVASDVGGIRDVVLNQVTGTLVPPRDTDRLAEAILELLVDKEKRYRMGLEGKKRASGLFDIKTVVAQTDTLYKELQASRARAA